MMNRKLMYTALSASLLLAACGTGDESADPAETVNTDTEGSGADTNADSENQPAEGENTDSEGTTQDDAGESGETNSDSDSGSETNTDSGSSTAEDNAASLPDASETESDEQDFKMQVLPDYELTSEEPGRDVLFVKEAGEWYMSIETAPAAEADYDKALEMMNEKLSAASTTDDPAELTEPDQLPKDSSMEKLKAFRAEAPEGPITAMLFEKDGLLVTLMMYDNTDHAYYDDFLKMGDTIQASN